MFLLRHHHVNELYLDPETPVYQQTANFQFMYYTVLFLGIFSIFYCGNLHFFVLHFFQFTLFSCFILFTLHHFYVALFCGLNFSCWTISTLFLFYVALCILFVLHSFYVLHYFTLHSYTLQSFRFAYFSSCFLSMVHFVHVVLFPEVQPWLPQRVRALQQQLTKPLSIVAKFSILDVHGDPGYVSIFMLHFLHIVIF